MTMTPRIKYRRWLDRIVFMVLFCLLVPAAAAADTGGVHGGRVLRISASEGVYCLAPWVDIFEDDSAALGFNEAKSKFIEKKFNTTLLETLNFGVTSSVYWLRFKIGTIGDEKQKIRQEKVFDLGEAFSDRIKWSLYDDRGYKMASGGSRTARDRFARIEVTPQPHTYYLKAQSTTGFLFHPQLFSWEYYLNHVKLTTILFGIFYGIIAAVAVYNLFLFFSFNDYSYLWYVLHLVFVFFYFFGINGLSGTYLLPGRPELIGMLNRSALGLMIASIALLTRSFLMTREKTPRFDRVIVALIAAACLLAFLNFISGARFVVNLLIPMGILVPSMMALAAWGSLRKGFHPARLFMAAWGLFLVGVVLFALTAGGILPFSFLGFNSFQAGAAIAAMLLSLALGDRIRTLREERASFKQNMERVTMILDSMESGVFLIESESRKIREINQAAENIIGKKREEIIGKQCWKFIRSAGGGACPNMDVCRSSGCREDKLVHATGAEIPVLKRAKLIELDGHSLIIESFVDISDLKRAEEALRRSEAKFRSLFESSRDAVMILDQKDFVDCNKATLDMFGCAGEEAFIGKQPSDFSPPEQPSGADSAVEAARHMESAFELGSHFFEWQHMRRNGEAFPAEVMLSEVEVEGRKVLQALVRDITQRKAMEDELKRLAATDPLTGVDNRRSFLDKGAYELLRSRRYDHPFSFLMVDVDHFKAVNDTHGHHVGDQVLKALVSQSTKTLRETDIFGRLGGEEFAVILTETDAETATDVGERLRQDLSEVEVESDQGLVRFTVSIGLAVLEREDDTLVAIMGRADSALYKAKASGRNRLVQS